MDLNQNSVEQFLYKTIIFHQKYEGKKILMCTDL